MSYTLTGGHISFEQNRLKAFSDFSKPFVDNVLSHSGLRAGKHCLDVGCGTGDSSIILGHVVGKSGSVTCVDSDWSTLEFTMKHLSKRTETTYQFLHACDLLQTDDIVNQYDYVFCRNVVMHQSEPLLFLQKMYEKVKPGGTLCVIECSISTTSIPYSEVIQRYNNVLERLWQTEGLDTKLWEKLPFYFSHLDSGPKINVISSSLSYPGHHLEGIISMYSSVLPKLMEHGISTKQEYNQWMQDIGNSSRTKELTVLVSGVWATKLTQ